MVSTQTELPGNLHGIVAELVCRYRPERVVLFGSYAYGSPHEDSDIDLLIVTDGAPQRDELWRAAHELGCQLHAPLQLVAMTAREYAETRDVIGGVAYPAHQWGVVLYDAQP
jgi:uncharacterized protein